MRNVFISYRRGDSMATAGRIRDRLVQEFGRSRVFVDVDDIPHGRDFVEVLESKVAECGVLLAIIGPQWLDARDADGKRRLDDKDDFVAIEIGSALERKDIAIIPVLIDGARMPTAEELPERLKPLARRNAIELRNSQFGSDAARLVKSINGAVGAETPRPMKIAIWLALLTLLGGGLYLALPKVADILAGEQRRTAPSRPAPVPVIEVKPAAPTPPSPNVATALARLREAAGPAWGNVTVGLRGGNRVKLGDQVVFEVASKVPGRLIVVDINAAGEVTQIFPNRFLAGEEARLVQGGAAITVPGPGYGFSGFKAVEPVGKGRLLALVQPSSIPADRLAMVREQATKGFEPVNEPGSYIDQIVRQVADSVVSGTKDWAVAITDYEITR
jgi:hypothetical protein